MKDEGGDDRPAPRGDFSWLKDLEELVRNPGSGYSFEDVLRELEEELGDKGVDHGK